MQLCSVLREWHNFSLARHGTDKMWSHLSWRLTESDITITPSVVCMDCSQWRYKHVTDVIPHQNLVRNVNIHYLVHGK